MFCVKCHARSIYIIIINNIVDHHHHQLRIYTIHKSLFHSIIIWFIISTLSPINLQQQQQQLHWTNWSQHETHLKTNRNTTPSLPPSPSPSLSPSPSPVCAPAPAPSPVWDAYRVRTRLRRHRLPAQRGVRHHQRLVQLQSARRQGLRQLSDLQAQERLQQQPGESLLAVG